MQSYVLRYYHINQTFLSKIGTWPYQSKTMRILIPCAIVFIDLSYLIPEIIRMVDTWGDIDITVECIISIIIVIGCWAKLLNLSFRIRKMRHLFFLIEHHWRVFNDGADKKILKDYALFGRKVIILYATYIYVSTVIYLTMPVTSQILDIVMPLNETRPRKFLFEVEYRVDREKYYYPILLHSYVAVVSVIIILVSVDTMYMAYVQHGCSLFAAIGYKLEHMVPEEHVYTNDSKEGYFMKTAEENKYRDVVINEDVCSTEKAITREFVVCLKKHQLAIQYTSSLESLFTLSIGIQLMCNMIAMSLTGIQLITNLDNIDDLLRYTSLNLATFFHLLCMTLPGQRLMDHSIDVFNKACRSRWYAFSLRNRRLLQILLYRSFVPCTMTAGKVYVMTMTNFSAVVQTAMSYFMTFSSLK